MKTNNKRSPKLFSLFLSLCMVLSLLPIQALADTTTDYSTPVPMLPVESADISSYEISPSCTDENNTIHYRGNPFIINAGLEKDGYYLTPGEFFSLEIEGDNIRKELVKDGYTKELYIEDAGSQAVFGFVLRFEDFNRRAGLKINNTNVLFNLYLALKDKYTLDELKQYSCAREFLDKTGFWKSDKRVEDGAMGYISPWEDTITPRANGLGYDTAEAYMDDMVIKCGYDGWYISDDKEYSSYAVVKKSAVSKDVLVAWADEKTHYPVFEKGDEYYVRAILFNSPPGNIGIYAAQIRYNLINDLGLDGKDIRTESREDTQKSYRLYCNCTYTQLLEAWAQEMDTWSGHWDYLLNGDTNFDYWPISNLFHYAGYDHNNYGSMGCICGAVPVNVDPEYRYYIEGPGDITIRVTGKNVNYANFGTAYNITGTAETVIHVVDDTVPTTPDPTEPAPTEPKPTEPTPTEPAANPFQDISVNDYFYQPVLWAVNKGITAGVSENQFGPKLSCTRGQIATFLWASAGKPEPTSTNNPFTDVKKSDYYYKAVLWAVENGITAGVSANRFGPNQVCTRAQTVTFLWAAEGKPTISSNTSFGDVSASAYYNNAVKWAVANGVTAGVGNGKFAPNQTCTRGQIVTFLYKAVG